MSVRTYTSLEVDGDASMDMTVNIEPNAPDSASATLLIGGMGNTAEIQFRLAALERLQEAVDDGLVRLRALIAASDGTVDGVDLGGVG